jgi:tricarballylate dehydrogenase
MNTYDVIVIGGGNAAFCAALAAQENGARVLVLEAAPAQERGGNSRFTAGGMRVAYNGLDDLARLIPDLSEEERANTDFGTYTQDQFYDDLCRITQYHTDSRMAETLVTHSLETMLWMRGRGVRFAPIYGSRHSKSKDVSGFGAA